MDELIFAQVTFFNVHLDDIPSLVEALDAAVAASEAFELSSRSGQGSKYEFEVFPDPDGNYKVEWASIVETSWDTLLPEARKLGIDVRGTSFRSVGAVPEHGSEWIARWEND